MVGFAGEIQQRRIEQRLHRELSDGAISQEEAVAFAEDMRAAGVDLARLASGLGAALGGGEVTAAANAGGTAAQENAFWIPIIMIVSALLETIDKVLMAKDAVDITQATLACDQGNQAACSKAKDLAQQMAIDTGVEVTIGAVVPGSKAAMDLLRKVGKKADAGTVRTVKKIAPNRLATQEQVVNHFKQNRRFWSREPVTFNGNRVYQRNDLIDPNLTSTWKQNGQVVKGTNLERMASGKAPIGLDGKSLELHHMTQSQNGSISEMTNSFHKENHGVVHLNPNKIPSGIDRIEFNKWRTKYWKNRANTWSQ